MSTLLTLDVTTSLASFKCHLMFKVFDGFVSLYALVTLLADRGLVGNVGGVHVDLVRLGSFDRLRRARNNVKSNVNKIEMEMNLLVLISIRIRTRSKLV